MINTQTNYYCIIYTIFLNQFVFSFKYNVHLKETRKYYTLKKLKIQVFQPFFSTNYFTLCHIIHIYQVLIYTFSYPFTTFNITFFIRIKNVLKKRDKIHGCIINVGVVTKHTSTFLIFSNKNIALIENT